MEGIGMGKGVKDWSLKAKGKRSLHRSIYSIDQEAKILNGLADFVVVAGIVILAGAYFMIFHKLFDVYYFGFKGILTTIFGCLFAAAMTLKAIVWVLAEYYGWLIAAVIIFFLVKFLGKGDQAADPGETKAVE
ncbi:MAG: hypothetical protein ACOYD6_06315 [Limnochordia bacterium]